MADGMINIYADGIKAARRRRLLRYRGVRFRRIFLAVACGHSTANAMPDALNLIF